MSKGGGKFWLHSEASRIDHYCNAGSSSRGRLWLRTAAVRAKRGQIMTSDGLLSDGIGMAGSCFLRSDAAQQPSQKVGSRDDALLLPPYKNHVVVDDIVLGMFRLHLHESDHVTEPGAHVAHDDRAMPIGFRPDRHLLEQHIAQKVVRVQHQLRLTGRIGENDPFLAGSI